MAKWRDPEYKNPYTEAQTEIAEQAHKAGVNLPKRVLRRSADPIITATYEAGYDAAIEAIRKMGKHIYGCDFGKSLPDIVGYTEVHIPDDPPDNAT